MICPTCKSDMIVIEHKRTELDYCPKCHGVWFDSGELELFLESLNLEKPAQFLSDVNNAAEVESSEKKRRCPICGQRMRKVIIGENTGILTDVCQTGDGLWFDGGEISQVIKKLADKLPGKAGLHNHVASFLGEVFKEQK